MPVYRRAASPEEQLSRYREAIIAGASAAELAALSRGLDPDLAATVRWSLITGRQQQPAPDPRFVRELRRRLEDTALTANPPAAPALHLARPETRVMAERVAPAAQHRLRFGWLALTVLAVVVLVAGAWVLRPVLAPAPASLSLVASGAPTTETLLDTQVNGAADRWTPLTVEAWQFQPGATLTIPPMNGPQWLVAETAAFSAKAGDVPAELVPGAGVVVPAGEAVSIQNPGQAPATLYRGVAATGFTLEEYDRDEITVTVALDSEALESLPPGESRVVFDKLTIPVGSTILAEAATGQDWFSIVSGDLGLTLMGDALPEGWISGREHLLAVDDQVPALVPDTHVMMRNAGTEPLTLLRLRVTPAPVVP